MKALAILMVAALLGGCSSLQSEMGATYAYKLRLKNQDALCVAAGIPKGTPGYTECMLNLRAEAVAKQRAAR